MAARSAPAQSRTRLLRHAPPCAAAHQPPDARSRATRAAPREAPLLLQSAVRLREPRRPEPAAPPSASASPASQTVSRSQPAADIADITHAEVISARDAWADAVSRRDLEAVCALYDPDGARLLGTLDCEKTGVRASARSIRAYFTGFLRDRHVSIAPLFCDGGDGAGVLRLGPGVAAYSGYYAFRLVPTAAPPCVAHAKFTFVYRRSSEDGRLLIALHNSGLTPVGIMEAALP
jgi:hypothetical protein